MISETRQIQSIHNWNATLTDFTFSSLKRNIFCFYSRCLQTTWNYSYYALKSRWLDLNIMISYPQFVNTAWELFCPEAKHNETIYMVQLYGIEMFKVEYDMQRKHIFYISSFEILCRNIYDWSKSSKQFSSIVIEIFYHLQLVINLLKQKI